VFCNAFVGECNGNFCLIYYIYIYIYMMYTNIYIYIANYCLIYNQGLSRPFTTLLALLRRSFATDTEADLEVRQTTACVGEQNSNYHLRKTKALRQFLLSYASVRRTLDPPLGRINKGQQRYFRITIRLCVFLVFLLLFFVTTFPLITEGVYEPVTWNEFCSGFS